ncbi:MAG: hypothetical protein K2X29_03840 [Candidatus Obscuribacterales bacterium]|nr:hypothetical protein [Candidatus Obscuribacterales bacterium]
MKKVYSALALLLSLAAAPQAQAADFGEYVQDTLLLPVRTAAIVSALSVTSPVRAARGGVETAKQACPDQSGDTLVFEYAAVPFGFAVGALAGPFEGAGETINKAWEKPFSSESFQVEN